MPSPNRSTSPVDEAQVAAADLVERHTDVRVLRRVLGGLPLRRLDERDGVGERPVVPAVVEVEVAVDDVCHRRRIDAGGSQTDLRRGRPGVISDGEHRGKRAELSVE